MNLYAVFERSAFHIEHCMHVVVCIHMHAHSLNCIIFNLIKFRVCTREACCTAHSTGLIGYVAYQIICNDIKFYVEFFYCCLFMNVFDVVGTNFHN